MISPTHAPAVERFWHLHNHRRTSGQFARLLWCEWDTAVVQMDCEGSGGGPWYGHGKNGHAGSGDVDIGGGV